MAVDGKEQIAGSMASDVATEFGPTGLSHVHHVLAVFQTAVAPHPVVSCKHNKSARSSTIHNYDNSERYNATSIDESD